ncbi:MAG: hypothetical protein QNK37_22260 [Acidobacteriota bacterium]|nr:hypothetical protein [Acidobacteriota bacterium]
MSKKTGFSDRELSMKRVFIVLAVLFLPPIAYVAYLMLSVETPLSEKLGPDSGSAYLKQLTAEALRTGNVGDAVRQIEALLAQNEDEQWSSLLKPYAVSALGKLRAEEKPLLEAMPANLHHVRLWWHHALGRDSFLLGDRWVDLGTPLVPGYYFSGLIVPQGHGELRRGFKVRISSYKGGSRSLSLGDADLTGEYWVFNKTNKIFCRDAPLGRVLARFGEREGKTLVELEPDAGAIPVNGVLTYHDPEVFLDYLQRMLPLEVTSREMRLRTSRHDILPNFNIGLGGISNLEVYRLVETFNRRTCLGQTGAGFALLPRERVTFVQEDDRNSMPFYVALEDLLAPRGLTFRVRFDGVLVVEKADPDAP